MTRTEADSYKTSSSTETHFVVMGKNTEISLTEIASVIPDGVITSRYQHQIISIQTAHPQRIPYLAGVVKTGKILTESELENTLSTTTLLGTSDKSFASKSKKTYPSIRRFKICDISHTDKDLVQSGTEIIKTGPGQRGVVQHYQNIGLYETIDFGKPASGMEVGMMPSKLAHIMINIALGAQIESTHTVRDPFCGFGTTNFVANALGHHTFASDRNITEFKRNSKRRPTTPYSTDHKITSFRHDVLQPRTQPHLKHTTAIVSEGRLGPTISSRTFDQHLSDHVETITQTYLGFFAGLYDFWGDQLPRIVITLPEYRYYDGTQVVDHCQKRLDEQSRDYTIIPELYARKKQLVGRRIVVIYGNSSA